MKKKKITINQILETAFNEWGKLNFQNTSLSLIHKELGITKAGLYRYFDSKQELIKLMNIHFTLRVNKIFLDIEKELADLNLADSLKRVIEHYSSFFLHNPKYSYFFMYLYNEEAVHENQEYLDSVQHIQDFFAQKIKISSTWLVEEDTGYFIDLVFSAVIYMIHYGLISSNPRIDAGHLSCFLIKGFAARQEAIDFVNIEKNCRIDPDHILKRDRILNAIAKVVAREGIWNTSTGKIACQLGMSKSSLYFYFENKSEMIYQMIFQELDKINHVVLEHQQLYTHFLEKLYSFIVVRAHYLDYDDEMLHIFKWLIAQDPQFVERMEYFKKQNEDKTRFFSQGFEEQFLDKNGLSKDFILGYLNIIITRTVLYCKLRKLKVDQRSLRFIYSIFLNGVQP